MPDSSLSLSACVEAFLLAKRQRGASARWLGTLASLLARFVKDSPSDTQYLTATLVQAWFLNLPMMARSRNNHLRAVKCLFNSAELRRHPERQWIAELEPCVVAPAENLLWTPDEFRLLIHAAPAHVLPVLVLGGFAKVRACEIRRLDWASVRLPEKRVIVRAGQAKTRRLRIVPLPAVAVAWLRTLGSPAGPVWPWGSQKFNADLRALAATCRLSWRPNALRNSAVTYDHILNPDAARVAREAGNSVRVLETEYFALEGVSRKTARAWFALAPAKAAGKTVIRLHA